MHVRCQWAVVVVVGASLQAALVVLRVVRALPALAGTVIGVMGRLRRTVSTEGAARRLASKRIRKVLADMARSISRHETAELALDKDLRHSRRAISAVPPTPPSSAHRINAREFPVCFLRHSVNTSRVRVQKFSNRQTREKKTTMTLLAAPIADRLSHIEYLSFCCYDPATTATGGDDDCERQRFVWP